MRFVIEWREVVGRGREIKELREKMGMKRQLPDYLLRLIKYRAKMEGMVKKDKS